MSTWPDQKYINFPFIKTDNIQGQNGASLDGISIGKSAGFISQGTNSLAIGNGAGYSSQQPYSVAIGNAAGANSQGTQSVAIGFLAAQTGQGQNSVAIGLSAGFSSQGAESVAIGYTAGNNTQGASSVAIGNAAGNTTQGLESVAIGSRTAANSQGNFSVAIGKDSGSLNQFQSSVAIGNAAGSTNQGGVSVAIGRNAGNSGQGPESVAIGPTAGQTTQGQRSVAIGSNAGSVTQSNYGVAIGYEAGTGNQGTNAIAIGKQAGNLSQSTESIAIGTLAGSQSLGQYSIAIGNGACQNASLTASFNNVVVINAQGTFLDPITTDSTYISPLRTSTAVNPIQPRYPDYLMSYDPTQNVTTHPTANSTKELAYGRHSMLLATYFFPLTRNQNVTYEITAANAISQALSTDPFQTNGGSQIPRCQSNIYTYFIYRCVQQDLFGYFLGSNFTCQGFEQFTPPGTITVNSCEGIYCLVQDTTGGGFNEAAYINLQWQFKEYTVNTEFSASIEYLQGDIRSNCFINGEKYKIMLLGANHTF